MDNYKFYSGLISKRHYYNIAELANEIKQPNYIDLSLEIHQKYILYLQDIFEMNNIKHSIVDIIERNSDKEKFNSTEEFEEASEDIDGFTKYCSVAFYHPKLFKVISVDLVLPKEHRYWSIDSLLFEGRIENYKFISYNTEFEFYLNIDVCNLRVCKMFVDNKIYKNNDNSILS